MRGFCRWAEGVPSAEARSNPARRGRWWRRSGALHRIAGRRPRTRPTTTLGDWSTRPGTSPGRVPGDSSSPRAPCDLVGPILRRAVRPAVISRISVNVGRFFREVSFGTAPGSASHRSPAAVHTQGSDDGAGFLGAVHDGVDGGATALAALTLARRGAWQARSRHRGRRGARRRRQGLGIGSRSCALEELSHSLPSSWRPRSRRAGKRAKSRRRVHRTQEPSRRPSRCQRPAPRPGETRA